MFTASWPAVTRSTASRSRSTSSALTCCTRCYWAKSTSRDGLATGTSLRNTSMQTPRLSTVIITCSTQQRRGAGRCSILTPSCVKLSWSNGTAASAFRQGCCLKDVTRTLTTNFVLCPGKPSSLPRTVSRQTWTTVIQNLAKCVFE